MIKETARGVTVDMIDGIWSIFCNAAIKLSLGMDDMLNQMACKSLSTIRDN